MRRRLQKLPMRRAKQDPLCGWRSHWQYYGLQHSTNERASWREHNNRPARQLQRNLRAVIWQPAVEPWLLGCQYWLWPCRTMVTAGRRCLQADPAQAGLTIGWSLPAVPGVVAELRTRGPSVSRRVREGHAANRFTPVLACSRHTCTAAIDEWALATRLSFVAQRGKAPTAPRGSRLWR
jgi:hypothetical protein